MSAMPVCPLPRNAVLPDYGVGGLFGFIRSVSDFLDGGHWSFAPVPRESPAAHSSDPDIALRSQPSDPLEDVSERVLVFLLVDGLGDAFLQRHGKGSHLLAHCRGRMTSVFPSTTASAVTSTLTGLAPAAHGLTGWFINDARFGGVLAPLPMMMRADHSNVPGWFATRQLFPYPTLFMHRQRPSMLVMPADIAHSPFSLRHGRGAGLMTHAGLDTLVDAVVSAVDYLGRGRAGGYVHAYYPDFDAVSHTFGCESDEAIEVFWAVDACFARLLDRLDGRACDLVVSADHGFIDSPPERFIRLTDYPEALEMLNHPLSGERRAAFCEVRPGAEDAFAVFVDQALAGQAVLVPSAHMLASGLFGPGPHHARLRERIGTHTLLMEANWTLWDARPGESEHDMLGVHGGLSPDEMWVPFIHAG